MSSIPVINLVYCSENPRILKMFINDFCKSQCIFQFTQHPNKLLSDDTYSLEHISVSRISAEDMFEILPVALSS